MQRYLYSVWVRRLLIILSLIGLVLIGVGYYYRHMLPVYWKRKTDRELRELLEKEPIAAARFAAFVRAVEEETDWRVYITSGLRSPEEQEVLKRQNVKNASKFRSKHVLGQAIDVNVYRRTGWIRYERLMKKSSRKRWQDSGILPIADRYRLKWGGNFKTYYDPVHFEIVK